VNRSPLFYPMSRGLDAEAGGAADLQTDVMRFMAILSLCLVAIFALVQSIPLAPQPSETPAGLPTEQPIEHAAEPAGAATRIELVHPKPVLTGKPAEPVRLERPKPARVRDPVTPRQDAETPAAAGTTRVEPAPTAPTTGAQRGFTLRFASDAALTRLVAQRVVGFYALTSGKSYRLDVDGSRLSFWTSSTPDRIHEMDAATVPTDVIAAYRRTDPGGADGVRWGVSLPTAMSSQLKEFLETYEGGALIIDPDGTLRREQ